jgi:hypothetical protein
MGGVGGGALATQKIHSNPYRCKKNHFHPYWEESAAIILYRFDLSSKEFSGKML